MYNQRFRDDVDDSHSRVETGIGILEDKLHMTAQGTQILVAGMCDIAPLKENTARHRGNPSQYGPAGRALART